MFLDLSFAGPGTDRKGPTGESSPRTLQQLDSYSRSQLPAWKRASLFTCTSSIAMQLRSPSLKPNIQSLNLRVPGVEFDIRSLTFRILALTKS